jgi:polar amino acid transport system permease protein
VLALLAVTAPLALGMGFLGATATRSPVAPIRWLGNLYIWMVRGVPDIIYFLFFVIALDQGIEFLKNLAVCPGAEWPWQGLEFRVCPAAKVPRDLASGLRLCPGRHHLCHRLRRLRRQRAARRDECGAKGTA